MRTFVALLTLATAFALPARAGWWDDLDKGERVRLADVIAQPKAFASKRITFTCVYHRPDQVYSPYFTRFHPEKHLNVTAWPDGAPLWEQQAFLADFPHLYLERTHVQRDELLAIPTFTRVEVTGEVRDVYRNLPWIQIHGIRRTGGTLGEAVVQRMLAGDNYARAADHPKAEAWYRQALRDPSLDEHYALRIRKRLGDVLRAQGRGDEATEVEGGTILGGTLPPRSDGSAPPSLPPPEPRTPAPASAAPSAVAGSLPGIPSEPTRPPARPPAPLDPDAPPGAPPPPPPRQPRLSGVR